MSLCWHLLPVRSINYSPLTVPVTSSTPLPRKGGKGCSTGLPGFPGPIWANPSGGLHRQSKYLWKEMTWKAICRVP